MTTADTAQPARTVAVIGSGSWGTAIARLLGLKGTRVQLWSHSADTPPAVNATHRNPRYLCDVELPNVWCTNSFEEACAGAESVVIVTPSSSMRQTARELAPFVETRTPVVVLSKGIEAGTGYTMADVLVEELGGAERVAVLSGPNHAEEISRELPAATCVACVSEKCALYFQELFATDYLRVYTTTDVIGVEVCAAAKNIVAIANGMVGALGLGDNASASLITRGCMEMSRLATAMGGNSQTCMGLAGMGDLIATCTSPHSRNRTLGEMLAQGKTLRDFEERMHQIAEGAIACRTVTDAARARGVEMPIAEVMRRVLWEDLPAQDALRCLLSRPNKPEFHD